MKKTILKVYSAAVMLNVWSMACLPLLVWGLTFAIFGTSNDPLWVIILSLSLVFFFLIFFAIEALYMTQRAEISEHGIAIYSIFFSTIKVIKWNELIDIRTQSIVTFSSAYGYHSSKDWIVLYTDLSQKEKNHTLMNRKKTGPWYISCTKRNITVLTEYVNKYASHISEDPDTFF